MRESPLLKHARRKMAEQRELDEERLTQGASAQKKGAVRNVFRGILLLMVLVALGLYFAQYR